MNIGIIIFIISVIITGVSALRDKSHEDRQNQRPNQKPSNEQPQEGGFFEKLEKTFKEISDELNDEPEKKQSKPYETSLPPLNKDWNEKEKKKHHILKKDKILHNLNVKQRLLMNIKIFLSQIRQHQEMIIMKNSSRNLNKM